MDILLTLGIGLVLIVATNLVLVRAGILTALHAAVLVGLVSLGIYLPVALVYWPGGDIMAIHLAVYLLANLACGMLQGGDAAPRGQRLHWGPATIVGFFVALVVIDSTFIILAERGLSPLASTLLLPEPRGGGEVISRFPGVVSHDFQEKEDAFNRYLNQRQQQEERGWQITKGWLQIPVVSQSGTFQVRVHTARDEPLVGANIQGQFQRPADSRLDKPFSLTETEPGVYRTNLVLDAPGLWNLVMQVRQQDALHEVRATTTVAADNTP